MWTAGTRILEPSQMLPRVYMSGKPALGLHARHSEMGCRHWQHLIHLAQCPPQIGAMWPRMCLGAKSQSLAQGHPAGANIDQDDNETPSATAVDLLEGLSHELGEAVKALQATLTASTRAQVPGTALSVDRPAPRPLPRPLAPSSLSLASRRSTCQSLRPPGVCRETLFRMGVQGTQSQCCVSVCCRWCFLMLQK